MARRPEPAHRDIPTAPPNSDRAMPAHTPPLLGRRSGRTPPTPLAAQPLKSAPDKVTSIHAVDPQRVMAHQRPSLLRRGLEALGLVKPRQDPVKLWLARMLERAQARPDLQAAEGVAQAMQAISACLDNAGDAPLQAADYRAHAHHIRTACEQLDAAIQKADRDAGADAVLRARVGLQFQRDCATAPDFPHRLDDVIGGLKQTIPLSDQEKDAFSRFDRTAQALHAAWGDKYRWARQTGASARQPGAIARHQRRQGRRFLQTMGESGKPAALALIPAAHRGSRHEPEEKGAKEMRIRGEVRLQQMLQAPAAWEAGLLRAATEIERTVSQLEAPHSDQDRQRLHRRLQDQCARYVASHDACTHALQALGQELTDPAALPPGLSKAECRELQAYGRAVLGLVCKLCSPKSRCGMAYQLAARGAASEHDARLLAGRYGVLRKRVKQAREQTAAVTPKPPADEPAAPADPAIALPGLQGDDGDSDIDEDREDRLDFLQSAALGNPTRFAHGAIDAQAPGADPARQPPTQAPRELKEPTRRRKPGGAVAQPRAATRTDGRRQARPDKQRLDAMLEGLQRDLAPWHVPPRTLIALDDRFSGLHPYSPRPDALDTPEQALRQAQMAADLALERQQVDLHIEALQDALQDLEAHPRLNGRALAEDERHWMLEHIRDALGSAMAHEAALPPVDHGPDMGPPPALADKTRLKIHAEAAARAQANAQRDADEAAASTRAAQAMAGNDPSARRMAAQFEVMQRVKSAVHAGMADLESQANQALATVTAQASAIDRLSEIEQEARTASQQRQSRKALPPQAPAIRPALVTRFADELGHATFEAPRRPPQPVGASKGVQPAHAIDAPLQRDAAAAIAEARHQLGLAVAERNEWQRLFEAKNAAAHRAWATALAWREARGEGSDALRRRADSATQAAAQAKDTLRDKRFAVRMAQEDLEQALEAALEGGQPPVPRDAPQEAMDLDAALDPTPVTTALIDAEIGEAQRERDDHQRSLAQARQALDTAQRRAERLERATPAERAASRRDTVTAARGVKEAELLVDGADHRLAVAQAARTADPLASPGTSAEASTTGPDASVAPPPWVMAKAPPMPKVAASLNEKLLQALADQAEAQAELHALAPLAPLRFVLGQTNAYRDAQRKWRVANDRVTGLQMALLEQPTDRAPATEPAEQQPAVAQGVAALRAALADAEAARDVARAQVQEASALQLQAFKNDRADEARAAIAQEKAAAARFQALQAEVRSLAQRLAQAEAGANA